MVSIYLSSYDEYECIQVKTQSRQKSRMPVIYANVYWFKQVKFDT